MSTTPMRSDLRGVAPADLPMALWHLHRDLAVGDVVQLDLARTSTGVSVSEDDTAASDSRWVATALEGAGFGSVRWKSGHEVVARRSRTLADSVGDGLDLIVVGLNPSLVAADAGVPFAGRTNRFWPAAVAAGLVPVERDVLRALDAGLGFTDMVKRATPRAQEIGRAEYTSGLARLGEVVRRLRPGAICIAGLTGWRAAVDRSAAAGPQQRSLGGRAVYVLPNPSGVNTHARFDDIVDHLRGARSLIV